MKITSDVYLEASALLRFVPSVEEVYTLLCLTFRVVNPTPRPGLCHVRLTSDPHTVDEPLIRKRRGKVRQLRTLIQVHGLEKSASLSTYMDFLLRIISEPPVIG